MQRLLQWLKAHRGMSTASYASGLYARSITLRRAGRRAEALAAARKGLSVLGRPEVKRDWPPTSATRLSLTIQIEQLAHDLGEPGAPWNDIVECLALLRAIPDAAENTAAETKKNWLPYFESKVGGPPQEGIH